MRGYQQGYKDKILQPAIEPIDDAKGFTGIRNLGGCKRKFLISRGNLARQGI